jgi:DNA-directed RNA polymerase subunit L
MEMKILKQSKEELEVELESVTLIEILRVYLNKDSSVTFAAWKQEHPTKNPILRVTTKGKDAKKAIKNAITAITADLDKALTDFKKL